jgi:hypothetical protein
MTLFNIERNQMFKVKIAAKDTTARIEMDVDYYWQEDNCICVRFEDGRERMYPMTHIWYLEILPIDKKK